MTQIMTHSIFFFTLTHRWTRSDLLDKSATLRRETESIEDRQTAISTTNNIESATNMNMADESDESRLDALLSKRLHLANLPTPISTLPRLSKHLGVTIDVKRDELTESIATGNKLRKLEYIVAAALRAGADTLVTCGGTQSNHW
jgi:hypothetical protein